MSRTAPAWASSATSSSARSPATKAGAGLRGEALLTGRTTGKRSAASKTGLREHGLALVDTVIAFHQAEMADQADWRVEVAHPTPAGNLVPDAVALLADGSSAFVGIDRTMSYARLLAKLERYESYRSAPASGRGIVARVPRSHWQETYAGPSLERAFPPPLFLFAPGPSPCGPGNEGGRLPRPCSAELADHRGDDDPAPAHS